MKRAPARLATACALAVATAIFTGTALADPGNGNSATAPGQVKQEQAAAQPQAPQTSVQQQAPAKPAQQTQAPGQVKKAQTDGSSSQAGTKPSSTTKHWTTTHVGDSPDVSKRYGNGKTATQIAHSRGAPDTQPLTGPGNSQPHKTYDCAHKNNKSGGVDVHAIKSYTASCTQTQVQVQPQTSVVETHVCGQTTLSTTSTQVVGVLHGKSEHLMTNTHSAHFTKHADTPVTATVTKTEVVPTGESCSPVSTSAPSMQVVQVQTQQTQQTQQSVSGALPATQGLPTAGAPAAGGVLGAQTTLATPKPASHGGVLGTVARVTGASLPFTGFPVWVAILIALALISGGLLVRRSATATR
jgi:hypothetical protein